MTRRNLNQKKPHRAQRHTEKNQILFAADTHTAFNKSQYQGSSSRPSFSVAGAEFCTFLHPDWKVS